ncbi:hypothetical protein [Kutzneria sp. NPDC052558]|uniref:hypothetical protein n=1 Tax=Kutzneria sp. NPDC052558 TaxID=3364121 RepID=UPI0037C690F2
MSRSFAEFWGPVEVRAEVLPLAALRSTIRSVRRARLSNAHALLERERAAGLRPYTSTRYAPDRVALGVIAESYGATAVLLDGTNRAVAALRHGCEAIAVTVIRPRVRKPPAAEVIPLGDVTVWAGNGPRTDLFRSLDERLFRPMPDILDRAEREVLAIVAEEDGNGPEGLHLGRVGRLGAVDEVGP